MKKIPLTQDLIYRMKAHLRPRLDDNKKIVLDEFDGSDYIVYDSHQNSPRGFGVRVGKATKRYIVQRKIGLTMTKWVVGSAADMTLEAAREKARQDIARTKVSQKHPRKLLEESEAGERTLGACFEFYVERLKKRRPPAKENTYKSISKARTKLAVFEKVRVSTIKPNDVTDWFDEIVDAAPTATEAAAKWATIAVNSVIEWELHQAKAEKRKPNFDYNPFTILKAMERYRGRKELENVYQRKGIRNPMTMDSLGKWLGVVWQRRSGHPTGADFLLLTLLWGMRRGEACKIKWRHRITKVDANESSYVDLEQGFVHVFDPKNRIDQRIPLAPCAWELLKRREESSRAEKGQSNKWVFPARSTKSKNEYYSDPQVFLRGIRDSAGIELLRPHDLRRTFGRVAESLQLSDSSIRKLLNHSELSKSTSRYTEPEAKRILEYMTRIEREILQTCPEVYRALAPLSDGAIGGGGGNEQRERRARRKAALSGYCDAAASE